jgi:hypothetical protein
VLLPDPDRQLLGLDVRRNRSEVQPVAIGSTRLSPTQRAPHVGHPLKRLRDEFGQQHDDVSDLRILVNTLHDIDNLEARLPDRAAK